MTNDFATYMRFLMDTHVPTEFKPHVYYNRHGDQFEVYWKDDTFYESDIMVDGTSQFCLHRSMETDEVIGITIYGVKHRLKKDNMLTNEPERQRMNREFTAWSAKQEMEPI